MKSGLKRISVVCDRFVLVSYQISCTPYVAGVSCRNVREPTRVLLARESKSGSDTGLEFPPNTAYSRPHGLIRQPGKGGRGAEVGADALE